MPRYKDRKKKNAGVGIDFARAKRKVGKKLPRTENYTDTSVKSKRIKLSQQSLAQAQVSEQILTYKKQSLQVLINQLGHYSPKVRQDAVQGLGEIAAKAPTEIISNTGVLLQKLLALLTDDAPKVRTAAATLFTKQLQHVFTYHHVSNHLQAAVAQLVSGLTHASPAVRNTSAQVLNTFAAMCGPMLLARHFGQCARMLAKSISRAKRQQSVKAASLTYLATSVARVREFLLHCLHPQSAGITPQQAATTTAAEAQSAQRQQQQSFQETTAPASTPFLTASLPYPSHLTTAPHSTQLQKRAIADHQLGMLQQARPAASSVTPYHPTTSQLHLRSFQVTSNAACAGLPSGLGEVGVGQQMQGNGMEGLQGGAQVGRGDVGSLLELMRELCGCWDDCATELRGGMGEGEVAGTALRDVAEALVAAAKLLGSYAPSLWSSLPPNTSPLASSLLKSLLSLWPIGPSRWLASPQLRSTLAAADVATAQVVALVVAAYHTSIAQGGNEAARDVDAAQGAPHEGACQASINAVLAAVGGPKSAEIYEQDAVIANEDREVLASDLNAVTAGPMKIYSGQFDALAAPPRDKTRGAAGLAAIMRKKHADTVQHLQQEATRPAAGTRVRLPLPKGVRYAPGFLTGGVPPLWVHSEYAAEYAPHDLPVSHQQASPRVQAPPHRQRAGRGYTQGVEDYIQKDSPTDGGHQETEVGVGGDVGTGDGKARSREQARGGGVVAQALQGGRELIHLTNEQETVERAQQLLATYYLDLLSSQRTTASSAHEQAQTSVINILQTLPPLLSACTPHTFRAILDSALSIYLAASTPSDTDTATRRTALEFLQKAMDLQGCTAGASSARIHAESALTQIQIRVRSAGAARLPQQLGSSGAEKLDEAEQGGTVALEEGLEARPAAHVGAKQQSVSHVPQGCQVQLTWPWPLLLPSHLLAWLTPLPHLLYKFGLQDEALTRTALDLLSSFLKAMDGRAGAQEQCAQLVAQLQPLFGVVVGSKGGGAAVPPSSANLRLMPGLLTQLPPTSQHQLLYLLPLLPHMSHTWRLPLLALLTTTQLPPPARRHALGALILARHHMEPRVFVQLIDSILSDGARAEVLALANVALPQRMLGFDNIEALGSPVQQGEGKVPELLLEAVVDQGQAGAAGGNGAQYNGRLEAESNQQQAASLQQKQGQQKPLKAGRWTVELCRDDAWCMVKQKLTASLRSSQEGLLVLELVAARASAKGENRHLVDLGTD